jgi:hypothetical protein
MPTFPLILASPSSDDGFIKVVVGIIVMCFWLGGALLSSLKKRADDAKRRARYNKMPAGYTRPSKAAPARLPAAGGGGGGGGGRGGGRGGAGGAGAAVMRLTVEGEAARGV